MEWPTRLSFNQHTASPRPVNEWVDGAVRAGVTQIGLNREDVEAFGFEKTRRIVKDAGIPVTIYSSIGYWSWGHDPQGRSRTGADNLRNLDEAVEIGSPIVGVTSGGLPPGSKDIRAARARAVEGLAKLIPHAVERNLRLTLEPLHPIYGPDQCLWFTLKQALDIIEALDNHPCLGIVLDTYHAWWDPDLLPQLERAGDRILMVQINDWSTEMVKKSNPFNRALMGEGAIDFDMFLEGLEGFTGPYEVEALNYELEAMPVDVLFARVAETYNSTFGQKLAAGRERLRT